MDRRQLIIVGGIVVLALLLAFPLTWIFNEPRPSPHRATDSRWSIRQTDAGGTEWTLTQASGLPAPKDANGVSATPVITVKTDVFQVGSQDVSIGLVLAGRDGERYQPTVVKGGSRLAAPKLRIVDEAGKVLLDDSFKYG
ncbi:MAG TPA: hypothetical protein PLS24_03600 [Sedimentisphaerales bacterium]|nr:hypothetical protein [Sedimentisphaerales bacterium]HOV77086.1 hypothetical protein [Sedimentisphaerales bacterium]HQI27824.1 hypothetical protein [Sedimentisphaerales bacterium]